MRRILTTLLAACVCLALSTTLVAAQSGQPEPTSQRAEKLLHFHTDQTEPTCAGDVDVDGVKVVDCAGLIDSFDGLSLSVAVRMPKDATGPLPTLVYLHAFGSNRGEFNASAAGYKPPFNADSFAARGYAVVTPAARGMGGSCGLKPNTGPHDTEGHPQLEMPHGPRPPGFPEGEEDFTCSRGWTHVAEREFEIRDWQYLLGLLVDAGVADAERLGVIGASYGGGQAWLLATSQPWATPRGDRTIRLSAAVPIAGWTSLQNSIAPNGAATDDRDGGRSHDIPYGIVKESWTSRLFLGATAIRFNQVDPDETHSYTPRLFTFWHKGEPYDTPEGAAIAAANRNKSALFAEDYLSGVKQGTVKPVPVLAIQGWNDSLFPAVEALQMYRKLKAADPRYPVSIFLGDVGHETAGSLQGKEEVKATWQSLANAFLDAYVLHAGSGTPGEKVVSMSTECSPESISATVSAADWDSMHPGLVTLRSDRPLTTQSGPPNTIEEFPTDPSSHTGCITQAPGSYSSDTDYAWSVPSGGITLLGLPKLMVDYQLAGDDATVIAKLWDRDGAGNRTLVTRGMYRLTQAGGVKGKLKFELLGNHYRFVPGHSIELEISQTDRHYLRPDSLPSMINFGELRLELPTARK